MKKHAFSMALVAIGAASAHAAPGTFKPPGGMDPTTMVNVSTGGTTAAMSLQQIGQAAAAAIPQTQADSGNGIIPRKDSNGNVTAPLNTTGGVQSGARTYLNALYPEAAANWSGRYRAMFFDNLGDLGSSPNTIHLGGTQDHTDAYLNLIGLIQGHSDNSGAILTVQDADSSWYGNRNGAGGTDGIVEFTNTHNNNPRLEAGQDITNGDGIQRTLTFTQAGFTVSPAFSAYDMSTIAGSGRIRVYSNWKNGNQTPSSAHALQHPNEYFGYMDASYATTATVNGTTVQTFPVMPDDDLGGSGWRTENSITPAAAAPGQNSGDTIDTTSDTTSSAPGVIWKYPHGAVFIGMGDHKFMHNDFANVIPGNDSITQAITGDEYDFLLNQQHDYQYLVQGVTMNVAANGYKLADGSVDLVLGGTGNLNHLAIWDGCSDVALYSSMFYVPGGCTLTLPASTSATSPGNVMLHLEDTPVTSGANSELTHRVGLESWIGYGNAGNLGSANSGPTYLSSIIHVTATVDASKTTPGTGGSMMGDIQFGQNNQIGGVALCGYATYCGFSVDGAGNADFLTSNQKYFGGTAASVLHTGVDANGNFYIQSDNGTTGTIQSSMPFADMTINGATFAAGHNVALNNGATVAANQALSLMPASVSNTLVPAITACDSYTICTTGNISGNVSLLSSSVQAALKVGGVFGNRSMLQPDGNGNWNVLAISASGTTTTPSNMSMNSLSAASITGNPLLSSGLSVANGQPLRLYPTASGVGAASFQGTDADTVALATNDGNPAILTMGVMRAADAVVSGGYIAGGASKLAALPASGVPDGGSMWCSDCTLNKVTGVEVYWHASSSGWTDSQNNALAN